MSITGWATRLDKSLEVLNEKEKSILERIDEEIFTELDKYQAGQFGYYDVEELLNQLEANNELYYGAISYDMYEAIEMLICLYTFVFVQMSNN